MYHYANIKKKLFVSVIIKISTIGSHLLRDVLQISLFQLSGLVVDQVDSDQHGESAEEQEEDALGADAGTSLGLALAAPGRSILFGVSHCRSLGLREAFLLFFGVAGHLLREVGVVLYSYDYRRSR